MPFQIVDCFNTITIVQGQKHAESETGWQNAQSPTRSVRHVSSLTPGFERYLPHGTPLTKEKGGKR